MSNKMECDIATRATMNTFIPKLSGIKEKNKNSIL